MSMDKNGSCTNLDLTSVVNDWSVSRNGVMQIQYVMQIKIVCKPKRKSSDCFGITVFTKAMHMK